MSLHQLGDFNIEINDETGHITLHKNGKVILSCTKEQAKELVHNLDEAERSGKINPDLDPSASKEAVFKMHIFKNGQIITEWPLVNEDGSEAKQ